MNIIKTNTAIPFAGVESKINRLATFILQSTFFGMLFLLFSLFVLGPVYGIYKRGFEAMLTPALICWGISLLILIPSTRYYIIKRKNISRKIIVDNTGLLFYNSKNEIVEQILYTELRSSKQDFDIYTVTTVGGSIVPFLEVTLKPEKKEETKRRIDMNLPLHVVKNKFTLYAHFMHGITIFRPDLKIDPMAVSSFSIDPTTWKVNRKGTSLGGWLLILAVFVISAAIFGLVFLLAELKN
ncbi:hypothetical protein [Chryseobacterium sp. BIGb0232]|uniref:hypothetical protein n=1 Tax=Chryseobacterium sp. BIGb0232 TaxID=2940598 RepID=UPI000F48A300|nr:hypothetical protein [Chryseobacterium sp. BIGb0232]MCS4302213.1 hypothetical protein [Chryseobacterium sp. BIGb0232]ROS18158.1 hypothetical protein EDF65_2550 [Chryseobacterium nakagawai]